MAPVRKRQTVPAPPNKVPHINSIGPHVKLRRRPRSDHQEHAAPAAPGWRWYDDESTEPPASTPSGGATATPATGDRDGTGACNHETEADCAGAVAVTR